MLVCLHNYGGHKCKIFYYAFSFLGHGLYVRCSNLANCRFTLMLLQFAMNTEPSINQKQVLKAAQKARGRQKQLSITVSSKKAIELDTIWRELSGRHTATMTVVVCLDLVSMVFTIYGFSSLYSDLCPVQQSLSQLRFAPNRPCMSLPLHIIISNWGTYMVVPVRLSPYYHRMIQ